jgi:ribosome-binding factor A
MAEGSRRSLKIASQIKENLSWLIENKLRDPGKGFITITRVRLSSDLKIASVYYSVLGKEEERTASAEALKRASAFLKHELSNHLNLRFSPELRFFYDDSLDYAARMAELFKKIHKNEHNR